MSGPLKGEAWYPAAREEVVRPDRIIPATLYFCERWLPRLGPEATSVLLWLRARLATSRLEGGRGECEIPSQEALARACGLGGIKSARRALRALEEAGFVERRPAYRWDEARRQTVHLPDRYLILMADPVAPEDAGALLVAAARRAVQEPELPFVERGGPLGPHTPSAVENSGGVTAPRAYTPGGCDGPAGLHTPQVVAAASVKALRAHRTLESNEVRTLNVAATQLVEDLVTGLGDQRSRRWFALVVERMPEERVRMALSEALQARRQGLVRKSAGAYFTDLVKRDAELLGVNLRKGARS